MKQVDQMNQAIVKKEVVNCPVVETVSVEEKAGSPQVITEIKKEVTTLENKFFDKEPIRLNLDYSSTINMGNFESVKISIGISVPVGQEVDKDTKGKIDSAYDFASKYLEDRIAQEIKVVEEYRASKNKK